MKHDRQNGLPFLPNNPKKQNLKIMRKTTGHINDDKESSLSIKPSTLALLLNELNNTSSENNNDPENVVNSK